jgi:hypothetical protein
MPTEKLPAHAVERPRLALWVWLWGVPTICGSAIPVARLVWEETVLTWRSGPQMLGFSLAHGSGAMLFLFPPILLLWIFASAILIARHLYKKRQIPRKHWPLLGAAGIVLAVMSLPYGFWQRIFAARLIAGGRAGQFLTYAAVTSDMGTVKALVSRGVPVDTTDRRGRTGVHAAAGSGNVKILEYLVAHDADVNALDLYGDSPLELALSNGHTDAAQFLSARGAKRMRGGESQRSKATEAIVRREIEEMR